MQQFSGFLIVNTDLHISLAKQQLEGQQAGHSVEGGGEQTTGQMVGLGIR